MQLAGLEAFSDATLLYDSAVVSAPRPSCNYIDDPVVGVANQLDVNAVLVLPVKNIQKAFDSVKLGCTNKYTAWYISKVSNRA